MWVPAVSEPNWPAVLSWLNVEWPEGSTHDFVRSGHGDMATVWNRVIEKFLASDCDWLFSCHTDIEFWPATLKRLLSWDKPIVSALMFMRNGPAMPHIWEGKVEDGRPGYLARMRETFHWYFNNHMEAIHTGSFIINPKPSDALYRVNFTSTGCTVIHRKVFEAIPPPWFMVDTHTADGAGGEDRYFCEKALAAGFPSYVDRSCVAGHMPINVSVGLLDFFAWMAATDHEAKNAPTITCNVLNGE